MPISHKISQVEAPWGKNAFESYAMRYSSDPQPMEHCCALQIDGTNAQILSIGENAPLITYEGAPVLLMSLSSCACFVNFQQGSNLIVIMPETRRPMQALLQELCPDGYQELLFQLSVLYDLEGEQAVEVLAKRNIAVWRLLDAFNDAVQTGKVKIAQILEKYKELTDSGERLFFFEEQLIEHLERAAKAPSEVQQKLLAIAPLFMIMERFGNAPGQVILLDNYSPLMLGKGDYMVFEGFKNVDDLINRQSQFLNFCQSLFTQPDSFYFDLEKSKVATAVERQPSLIKSQENQVLMDKNVISVKIKDSHPFSLQFFSNHNQEVELGDPEKHTTFCQFLGILEVQGQKQIVPAFITLQPGEKAVSVLKASFQEGDLALLLLSYQ